MNMVGCSIPACIMQQSFPHKAVVCFSFLFSFLSIVVKIAFSKEFNLLAEFGLNAKVIKLRGILFSPFSLPRSMSIANRAVRMPLMLSSLEGHVRLICKTFRNFCRLFFCQKKKKIIKNHRNKEKESHTAISTYMQSSHKSYGTLFPLFPIKLYCYWKPSYKS